MTENTNVPGDSEGPIGQKVKAVQRRWFDDQPINEQAEIIKPAFEKAHPTDADVKEIVDRYGAQINHNYSPD